MANSPISQLPAGALTGANVDVDADFLAIDDTSAGNTKRITPKELIANSPSFLQAGTGAVARSVQSKFRDMVSLMDFGAVGDGATDDVTAVQNWITYIINNNKKGYAPANNYRCSAKIAIPRTITGGGPLLGLEIEGDGGHSGIFTAFSFPGTTTGFVLDPLNYSQNASDGATTEAISKWLNNVRLKNLRIVCNGTTAGTDSVPNPDTTQRGIDLHGINDCRLENLLVVGFGYNVRLRSGAEIHLRNVNTYYGWNNLRFERAYSDVGDMEAFLEHCTIGSGQYPIVLDHVRNVVFGEGCGLFPGSVTTDRGLPLILVREGFLGSQGTSLSITQSALEKNSGAFTSKTGYMISAPHGINTLVYNDNQCDTSYFPYHYIEKGWRQITIRDNRFSPDATNINVADGASEDLSANLLLLRHTADVVARAADVVPAVVLTLSVATVGTGRTVTAASAVFAGTSADNGKYILTADGIAIITTFSSTTVATIEIIDAFPSVTIASGAWTFSNAPSAGAAPYYLFGNLDIQGNTPRENDFSVKEARTGAAANSLKPYFWHYAPPYVKPLVKVPQVFHPVGVHYAFSGYTRSAANASMNTINAIVGNSGTPTVNTATFVISKLQANVNVSFVAGIIVTREDGADAFVAPQIYLDGLTAGDASYFRVLNPVPLGIFTAADGTTKFKKYGIVTDIPRAPQASIYIRMTNFYGIDYAQFYLLDKDFEAVDVLEGQGMAANSVPTEGEGRVNDFVANINPAAGEPVGWINVSAGAPGTWVPVGGIQAANAYTPTNVTTDRAYDADTVVITELADVVGTLIADLQANGILK